LKCYLPLSIYPDFASNIKYTQQALDNIWEQLSGCVYLYDYNEPNVKIGRTFSRVDNKVYLQIIDSSYTMPSTGADEKFCIMIELEAEEYEFDVCITEVSKANVIRLIIVEKNKGRRIKNED
jgi:hypothetical protein